MDTIMPPNFNAGAAKIVKEIRAITYITDVDAASIEKILKAAIHDYYDDGRFDGYADGYEHGYEYGHFDGYADGHAKKHY